MDSIHNDILGIIISHLDLSYTGMLYLTSRRFKVYSHLLGTVPAGVKLDVFFKNGDLSIIKWLVDLGWSFHESKYMNMASLGGSLEVVKWLRDNGGEWDKSTSYYAVLSGSLSLCKWLDDERCPQDPRIAFIIPQLGRIDMLQWSKKNFPWDKQTCALAAYRGQIELLEFLRENGCPWDETVCSLATQGGQFKTIKWLRSRDAPWDEKTYSMAGIAGNREMLQWLEDNGCPFDRADYDYIRRVYGGHFI